MRLFGNQLLIVRNLHHFYEAELLVNTAIIRGSHAGHGAFDHNSVAVGGHSIHVEHIDSGGARESRRDGVAGLLHGKAAGLNVSVIDKGKRQRAINSLNLSLRDQAIRYFQNRSPLNDGRAAAGDRRYPDSHEAEHLLSDG